MLIKDFVLKAISQDERNVFEEIESEINNLPSELETFYKYANPIDVEVSMGGNSVRFYQMDELKNLQLDYKLPKGRFVFATCNSDPIYIFNGKIYSCYHGNTNAKDEFVADDFEDFLGLID